MSTAIERILIGFYTLSEAAQVSGIHRITLWRWIRDGKLKAYRVGREVLIEKKVIAALKR